MAEHFVDDNKKKYHFLDLALHINALLSCLHLGSGPNKVGLVMANLAIERAYSLEHAYC